MLGDSNVSVSSDVNVHVCSHCLSGKMSKLPFSGKLDRVDIHFHKIHTDVWGPSPVVSVEGFRCYVSFVDEATRFVEVFPLMNNSEVFGTFVRFCAYVDNQFNTKIKVLQSDGDGEFLSNTFKDYLATYGILHFIPGSYTPQQNGLVERKHRHIVENAITMLNVAKLPLKCWYHAVWKTKNLKMQSEFGKLFDKKPVVVNLMVSPTNQDASLSRNLVSSASPTSIYSRDSNVPNHAHDPNLDDVASSSKGTLSNPYVLPVLSLRQLEAVLPFTTSSVSTASVQADVLQGIQTGLKIGTITRKAYTALATILLNPLTSGLLLKFLIGNKPCKRSMMLCKLKMTKIPFSQALNIKLKSIKDTRVETNAHDE
nr:uncharacterized protein LOC114822412 [Malus domestica]